MPISNAQQRAIVTAISEDFLANKSDEKLASVTQDEIDCHILPIITLIEDEVVKVINEKSVEAFKNRLSSNVAPWWED